MEGTYDCKPVIAIESVEGREGRVWEYAAVADSAAVAIATNIADKVELTDVRRRKDRRSLIYIYFNQSGERGHLISCLKKV